jgi:DNA repair protein RadC
VNGLAHELVERFGSLAGVLDAAEEELCRVPGVGQHTAVLLKLIPAAGARYLQSRADLGEPVRRTEDAYALLEPYFFGARNEMIYLLALDGKNKPLGVRKVAEGSICAANINLRRIMEEAAALRAPQIWPTTTSATWPSPPRWTSPQLRLCGRPWRGWASSCWTTWSLWTGIWCPCGTAG